MEILVQIYQDRTHLSLQLLDLEAMTTLTIENIKIESILEMIIEEIDMIHTCIIVKKKKRNLQKWQAHGSHLYILLQLQNLITIYHLHDKQLQHQFSLLQKLIQKHRSLRLHQDKQPLDQSFLPLRWQAKTLRLRLWIYFQRNQLNQQLQRLSNRVLQQLNQLICLQICRLDRQISRWPLLLQLYKHHRHHNRYLCKPRYSN